MPLSFFNNSGNSYGSAIPFQRIVEPAQLGMFLNLEQAELLRIQRYNEHWRFYFGKHWIFDREDSEPLVTLNFCRLIVDKSVSFLVKNGFEIEAGPSLENIVEPFLDEVWRYNDRQHLLYDMATMGSCTGDVFLLVTYSQPTQMAISANPYSGGSIKIQLLGSEQVYPSWDPLNIDVLTSVRIETLYYDDRNQLSMADRDDKASHAGRELYVRKFTQIITPTEIIEQYEGGQPIRRENVLGEIPVVHIKNLPLPREFYGLSDLDGIIDLQRELNEKSTDVSDIIAYQAAPVTVITGAKASQLERGARQIWSGLPTDARVMNLGLDSNLGASYQYLEYIKKALLQIAEIPEVMLETPPISNTSGVALSMQYQPIVDKTKRKRPFYESGLERVNYFILRIATAMGMLHLPYDLCKTCGGRIVEVLDEDGPFPRMIKKCYRIDPQDFSFLTPEQIEVPHLRQHSFGIEQKDSPQKQVTKEHKKLNPSFWDPETEEDQVARERRLMKNVEDDSEQMRTIAREEDEAQMESAKMGEQTNAKGVVKKGFKGKPTDLPKPSAKMEESDVKPPQLSAPSPKMPEEPEPVVVSTVWVQPLTGETQTLNRERLMLVPTGCKNAQYQDPFHTNVSFKDALPRDVHLDAALHQQYLGMGIVSKEWVRRQSLPVPKEDFRMIDEELKAGPAQAAGAVMEQGGGEDGSLAAPPSGMQGMDLQRKLGAIGGKKSKPGTKQKEFLKDIGVDIPQR